MNQHRLLFELERVASRIRVPRYGPRGRTRIRADLLGKFVQPANAGSARGLIERAPGRIRVANDS